MSDLSEQNRKAFISAMRGVAHSVCVVTTQGVNGRAGATVSAFSSVSADPPTALICLNTDTRIATEVVANGFFNINILPEAATAIANRFAGMDDEKIEDRFDGIELVDSEYPVLKGATLFHCQVQEAITAGSHRVIIGLVLESEQIAERPLMYFNGAYCKVDV